MRAFDDFAAAGEPGPRGLEEFIEGFLAENGPAIRNDIREAIITEWRRVSGRDFEANLTSKLKKALATLVQEGRIVSLPAKGYYDSLPEGGDPKPSPPPATVVEDDEDLIEEMAEFDEAEIVIGSGPEFVYAFYIDVYRKVANLSGNQKWPIKIGRSVDIMTRMNAHTTALPDAPVLAAILRTDDSKELEKALHAVLTFRGKKYDGDGGGEWYLTTPQEIEDLYRGIVG